MRQKNSALFIVCSLFLLAFTGAAVAKEEPASAKVEAPPQEVAQPSPTATQEAKIETKAPQAEPPAGKATQVPTPAGENNKELAPFEGMIGAKGAKYVGTEACESCHEQQAKEFKRSTHARIGIEGDNVSRQGCEMCHGPGSVHVDNGGGKGTMINPRKDPTICFTCHIEKKAEFRLPYHHPVMEGHMGCVDCHTPHGEDVRPWTATSVKDVNEACFRCHKDQRGPFVWEHEALREGCTTCHKVHGSIYDKMLIVRDANLCLRCHTQVAFPTIGQQNHAARLKLGPCFSGGCHTAVHGSQFSAHLRY